MDTRALAPSSAVIPGKSGIAHRIRTGGSVSSNSVRTGLVFCCRVPLSYTTLTLKYEILKASLQARWAFFHVNWRRYCCLYESLYILNPYECHLIYDGIINKINVVIRSVSTHLECLETCSTLSAVDYIETRFIVKLFYYYLWSLAFLCFIEILSV